ncbi:MAG: glycosyltransferase family 2 protein [Flavitalea sp.]
MKIIFWSALLIISYTYIGYPLLLYIMVKLKELFRPKKDKPRAGSIPSPAISLVIAAYNEEEIIEEKIHNCLELNYPADLTEIIFITDGSTDHTAGIIARYPSIRLLHEPQRKGKLAAMNRASGEVKHPFIIFSDANSLLNKDCIANMIRHYSDERIGGVAGEKRISSSESAIAAGEGLYWKYESAIKSLDARFHTGVGAAGELFSIRTALYEKLPEDTIIEDFVQSLKLCIKGYRVAYEPEAIAEEKASLSVTDEMERKIRISAGAFQAMGMLRQLFNIVRYPLVSFQFLSHRILRWTLCPLALIVFFFSSLILLFLTPDFFYRTIFSAQVIFYVSAAAGWYFALRNIRMPVLYAAFYFTFMNFCVFAGFSRYVRNTQSVIWHKAQRKQ